MHGDALVFPWGLLAFIGDTFLNLLLNSSPKQNQGTSEQKG